MQKVNAYNIFLYCFGDEKWVYISMVFQYKNGRKNLEQTWSKSVGIRRFRVQCAPYIAGELSLVLRCVLIFIIIVGEYYYG